MILDIPRIITHYRHLASSKRHYTFSHMLYFLVELDVKIIGVGRCTFKFRSLLTTSDILPVKLTGIYRYIRVLVSVSIVFLSFESYS